VEETGPDRYRRGLYTFWRRSAPFPAALIFDTDSRDGCSVRRHRTNTPLQALNLMNDPLFVESSGGLAQRMLAVPENTPAARARLGFRLCVARPPSEVETQTLVKLYERSRERFTHDPAAATALLAQAGVAPHETPAELAAWTFVANTLLCLDETISKN
jgi:hypothetical protein